MLCIFFSVNSICSLNLVLTPCAQVFSIEYGDMQALVLYVNNPKTGNPHFPETWRSWTSLNVKKLIPGMSKNLSLQPWIFWASLYTIVPEAKRETGHIPMLYFYRNCWKMLVLEMGILYIPMEVRIKRPYADPAKPFQKTNFQKCDSSYMLHPRTTFLF